MIKTFNFKTALLLAAMAISATTFYSCNKDDDKPEDPVKPVNNDTPENPETQVINDVKVEDISSSIKTLADVSTDGKPVQLTMDASTTAQDVITIAQALQQNSTVKIDLDLSKTEMVSVPAGAFKGTKNLTSVTFPSKVAEISDNAFKGCTTLESVTIKPTLTKSGTTIKIGASSFENCTALDSVIVPKADIETIEIDPTAFEGTQIALFTGNKFTSFEDVKTFCPESVLILAHVTEIPENAFYKSFPYTYTVDGKEYEGSHSDSLLVSVIFADGIKLTKIGNSAFAACQILESLSIPDGVKVIGESAFWACGKWKNPLIPSSVEEICKEAFMHVNMGDDFEVPSTVTNVGYRSFWWYDGDNHVENPDGGWTTYPYGNQFHISVRVATGGAQMFCLQVLPEPETLTIPNSWTEIPIQLGWTDGFRSVKSVVFEKNSNLEKILEYNFASCEELTSIEIPASVKEIEKCIFMGAGVQKVTFEKGSKLEKIAPDAFYGVNWNTVPNEIHLPIFCELTGYEENELAPLPSGTTIYVPSNLVDQFKAAVCYKNCEIFAEED